MAECKTQWRRVRKGKACPVCEADSWCVVSDDGTVAMCMRVKSDKPKELKSGEIGYIHRLVDAPTVKKPFVRKPAPPKMTDTQRHMILAPRCRSWFVKRGDNRERLAAELGVAAWALDEIRVGWNEEDKCWTFPEMNHRGQIVGVSRRFLDGSKFSIAGFGRGMTYSDNWRDGDATILIVEGGSDVAAGITMGLTMIGRPSNTGGLVYLEKMLDKSGRRAIIIGERDAKDREALPARHDPTCFCCGQCFPGRHGAVETSKRLSQKLQRIVPWSFVPAPHKDLRTFLNSRRTSVDDWAAMQRLGKRLMAEVQHSVKN